MATESSFDVVSELNRQELVNALDQTRREIQTRYDFKNTGTDLTLEDKQIVVRTDSDFRLASVKDILETRAVRRGISLKAFSFGKPEPAAGGTVRQRIELREGISDDLARKIVKLVRDSYPKARAQVQGDAVRVFSKSKDELQGVIQTLRAQDYPVDLQFTNRR